jgi:hypothetical protein
MLEELPHPQNLYILGHVDLWYEFYFYQDQAGEEFRFIGFIRQIVVSHLPSKEWTVTDVSVQVTFPTPASTTLSSPQATDPEETDDESTYSTDSEYWSDRDSDYWPDSGYSSDTDPDHYE